MHLKNDYRPDLQTTLVNISKVSIANIASLAESCDKERAYEIVCEIHTANVAIRDIIVYAEAVLEHLNRRRL